MPRPAGYLFYPSIRTTGHYKPVTICLGLLPIQWCGAKQGKVITNPGIGRP